MARRTVIISCILLLAGALNAKQELNFRIVEDSSYRLYEMQAWKELASFGEMALDQGFDYYYLRMRIGIAYYEMKDYLLAADHFKAASTFNHLERAPSEYLYYSYLYSGKYQLAKEVEQKMPESARSGLANEEKPPGYMVYIESGPIFHGAAKKAGNLDLDGSQNIYGEWEYPVGGWYSNVALSYSGYRGLGVMGAFTYVNAEKQGQVMLNDTIRLDQRITQTQYQAYLQLPVYLNHGITLKPYFHFINLKYEKINTDFDDLEKIYTFTPLSYDLREYLSGLNFVKDWGRVGIEINAAYSTVGGGKTYQVGAGIFTYPFGNLDLYLRTTFSDQFTREQHQFVLEQELAFKIAPRAWTNVFVMAGPVRNYFHRTGYIVYNTGNLTRMIGGIKLNWYISQHISLAGEYKNLWQENAFIRFQNNGDSAESIPVNDNFNYFSHLILASIIWKF